MFIDRAGRCDNCQNVQALRECFLFLGTKVVQKLIPTDVLIECHGLANAAEARGKEDVRPGIARFAFIAILAS